MDSMSKLILADVLAGRKEFLSLNFGDAVERDVALECVKKNENYLYLLDSRDADQRNVILAYLALSSTREQKYEKVLKLVRQQLDKEILGVYIKEKIEEGKEKYSNNLDVYKSFDSKDILRYNYETKEGETLCYFDKALGIPTKLIIKAEFKLIIVDALKLVKKLDIALGAISFDNIMDMLNRDITETLRSSLLKFIEEENISFYQLSRNYSKIAKAIIKGAENILGLGGIQVADMHIFDISVSNNAGKMLEEQYFALAEAERVKEYENRVNEASLALYEKKAQIHEKYPNFPVSLTEAEKDFAFDRYLRKENRGVVYSTKLDEIKLDLRDKTSKIGTAKEEIIVPKEPLAPKQNKFIIPYTILFALFVIASVATYFLVSSEIGLYALIATIVVFGVIGIILYVNVNKNKKIYPSKKEYQKLYDEYQKELALYHEKKEENYKAKY